MSRLPFRPYLQPSVLRDEDAGRIVTRHHELLHKYNETKDATQVSSLSSSLRLVVTILIGQLEVPYWQGKL